MIARKQAKFASSAAEEMALQSTGLHGRYHAMGTIDEG